MRPPWALVHAPQSGGRELAGEIAASGAFVCPTLAIIGGSRLLWDPTPLDDPRIQKTVSPDVLAMLALPDIRERALDAGLDVYAPNLGAGQHKLALRAVSRPGPVRRRLRRAIRMVRHLHDAGVPLVVGADAGGSPIAPYLMHGAATHTELALLAEAGLPPLAIIAAATETPARMLGLEDEIGQVEPGYRADLLIVDGDPLADAGALSRPAWVIRAGEARTPEGWMTD